MSPAPPISLPGPPCRPAFKDGISGAPLFSAGMLMLALNLAAAADPAGALSLSQTNAPALASDLPDLGSTVLRLGGSLILVLGLFLAGVWCFKNWPRLALRQGKPSRLQILEIKPLGNKQAVYLVGYEQQRLLLGSSPTGISLLTHLPEAEAGEEEESAPAPPTFVDNLQTALQSRTGT